VRDILSVVIGVVAVRFGRVTKAEKDIIRPGLVIGRLQVGLFLEDLVLDIRLLE
jgi:hypothetical protein